MTGLVRHQRARPTTRSAAYSGPRAVASSGGLPGTVAPETIYFSGEVLAREKFWLENRPSRS